MTVAERIADLLSIEDPVERLQALVDAPRLTPQLRESERTAARRVSGCVTPVHISVTLVAGRLAVASAADSPVVAALVDLTCAVYDGLAPGDVGAVADPVAALGFDRRLSPTRVRGLAALRVRLRAEAENHLIGMQ